MKNSCMDCTKRYIGCHSECKEYKQFVEKNKAVSRARFLESMERRGSKNFEKNMIYKIRRNGK